LIKKIAIILLFVALAVSFSAAEDTVIHVNNDFGTPTTPTPTSNTFYPLTSDLDSVEFALRVADVGVVDSSQLENALKNNNIFWVEAEDDGKYIKISDPIKSTLVGISYNSSNVPGAFYIFDLGPGKYKIRNNLTGAKNKVYPGEGWFLEVQKNPVGVLWVIQLKKLTSVSTAAAPISGLEIFEGKGGACQPVFNSISISGTNVDLATWLQNVPIVEYSSTPAKTIAAMFRSTESTCPINMYTVELWNQKPTTADTCSTTEGCLRIQVASDEFRANGYTQPLNTGTIAMAPSTIVCVKNQNCTNLSQALALINFKQDSQQVFYLRIETTQKENNTPSDWADSKAYPFILKWGNPTTKEMQEQTVDLSGKRWDEWILWDKTPTVVASGTCTTVTECLARADLKFIDQVFKKKK